MKHAVLGLLDDGSDEVVLVGDVVSFLKLLRTPFTRSPVEGLSVVDDLSEGSDDLLHRNGGIVSMSEDDVDVGSVCEKEERWTR